MEKLWLVFKGHKGGQVRRGKMVATFPDAISERAHRILSEF